MNKIYKVVWSKVKNVYVVASELAKSRTKSPKSGVISRAVVAGVLACVISCGAVMPMEAEAYTYDNQTATVTELQADANPTTITNHSDVTVKGDVDLPVSTTVSTNVFSVEFPSNHVWHFLANPQKAVIVSDTALDYITQQYSNGNYSYSRGPNDNMDMWVVSNIPGMPNWAHAIVRQDGSNTYTSHMLNSNISDDTTPSGPYQNGILANESVQQSTISSSPHLNVTSNSNLTVVGGSGTSVTVPAGQDWSAAIHPHVDTTKVAVLRLFGLPRNISSAQATEMLNNLPKEFYFGGKKVVDGNIVTNFTYNTWDEFNAHYGTSVTGGFSNVFQNNQGQGAEFLYPALQYLKYDGTNWYYEQVSQIQTNVDSGYVTVGNPDVNDSRTFYPFTSESYTLGDGVIMGNTSSVLDGTITITNDSNGDITLTGGNLTANGTSNVLAKGDVKATTVNATNSVVKGKSIVTTGAITANNSEVKAVNLVASNTGSYIVDSANMYANTLIFHGTPQNQGDLDRDVFTAHYFNTEQEAIDSFESYYGRTYTPTSQTWQNIQHVGNYYMYYQWDVRGNVFSQGHGVTNYYGVGSEIVLEGSSGSGSLSENGVGENIQAASIKASNGSTLSAKNIKTTSGDLDATGSEVTATGTVSTKGVLKAGKLTAGNLLGVGSGMSSLGGGLTVAGQVKGVSAGTADTDAVNLKQMKDYVAANAGGGSGGTTYTAGNGIAISDSTISAKAGTNVTVNSSGINVTGNGSVASGNTGLISGGTAYTELRPSNGSYVKQASTTAANLKALDTQVKANADASSGAIKGLSVNGKTITYTKNDGTTGTITTQDNDTKYTAGNGIALSGTTFSAKAGTNVTVNSSGINVTGNGSVASGNTGLISGGTAYTELRPTADGSFVKKVNTTAQNLSALDTAAKSAVKGITANGSTLTLTKGDGSTSTVTLTDNDTKYTAGNGLALSGTTFSAKAGTNVTVNANGISVTGNGTVSNGNSGLISGGTAYSELRPADGNYVKAANTTAANLKAIDDKIGTAASANGTYTKTGNTVNQNLKALDTGLKNAADSISSLGDDKANKDGSNVAEYAQQWADAIGTGKVAANDTKLVTGKTVYDALHDENGDITVKNINAKNINADKVETKELVADKATVKELHTDTLEVNKQATFHDNVTMDKDLEVKGTTTTGNLVVKDSAEIGGDLTVKGTTNLKDTNIDGDLTVTGLTTLQDLLVKGNFTVEGSQNIGGDLNVDGTTKTKDLEVDNDASIGGSLTVDGKSTFNDDVSMKKNLDVDGKATVGSLEVEGNGKVNGNWTVGGNEIVNGNSHILGNQLVDGKSTVGSQEVLGDSVIDGKQTVKGDSDLQGNVHVGKDLTVDGKSTLSGDVIMEKNAEVGKNLTVKGNTDLQGNARVGEDLTVDGYASIGKDLSVAGVSNLHDTYVDGLLDVTGQSAFHDNVVLDKDLSVAGTSNLKDTYVDGILDVSGKAGFHDDVAMDKNLVVSGNATVKGDTDMQGNAHVGKDLTVDGTSNLKGDVNVGGNLSVAGTSDFADNVIMQKDLSVAGNTNIGGKLDVADDASFHGNVQMDKDLVVDGDTNLHGNLAVDGVADFNDNVNVHKNLAVDGESTFKGKVTAQDDLEVQKDLSVMGKSNLHDTVVDGTLEVNKEAAFHDNVQMDKDLVVKGNGTLEKDLTVNGNTKLNGNTDIGGNLKVTGTSEFMDNVVMHKDLEVEGNEKIGGNLEVVGNITGQDILAKGNLTVMEDTDLQKNVHVGQDLDVDGTTRLHDTYVDGLLDVAKESRFHDKVTMDKDLEIFGDTKMHGKLTVDGVTEFNDDVIAHKNLTVDENLHVKGDTVIDKGLTVAGDTDLQGDAHVGKNLAVDGVTTLNDDVFMNANATVEKDLHVKGNTTVDGDTHLNKDLTVEGNTILNKDLTVQGDTYLNKTLTVEGDTTLKGNTTINKNLRVDGDAEVFGDTHLHKDLYVDNDSFIGGNQTVNKNLNVGGDSNFAGDVTMQKDLKVNGDTRIDKNLSVGGESIFEGDATFNNNVNVLKDIRVGGDSHVGGSQYISKNLDVAGESRFRDNVTMDKNLHVAGDTAIDGSVHVAKDLKVDGDTVVNGTIVADRILTSDGKDMSKEVDRLDGRIDKVGAQASALAGLRPVDADADQLWSFSAAYGNYKGENAGAVGLFYRPTERVLFGVGGTFGDSDNMVNASVSFALNKGVASSKSALQQQVKAQNAKIANMEQAMKAMADKLNSLSLISDKKASFPDVPAGHWAKNAVDTLHGNNMVQGYPDGEFKGNRPMTRYEYAEMLFNALSKGARVEQKHLQEYVPELRQVAANSNNQKLKQQINSLVPVQGAK